MVSSGNASVSNPVRRRFGNMPGLLEGDGQRVLVAGSRIPYAYQGTGRFPASQYLATGKRAAALLFFRTPRRHLAFLLASRFQTDKRPLTCTLRCDRNETITTRQVYYPASRHFSCVEVTLKSNPK
jgi:hypothetical protein